MTTPLWYVLGFAFAGITFVFITVGAAWLLSHRSKGDRHKGLPYESGIDTFGDTRGRFGLSFYLYALLIVAFTVPGIMLALNVASPWVLLSLALVPRALRVATTVAFRTDGETLTKQLAATAQILLGHTLLMSIGLAMKHRV